MRVFGLIGKPLTHSFSQSYFSEKFSRENIADAVYSNYELNAIEHLPALIKQQPSLQGLNVTIPYKEAVLHYLDEQSPEVKHIKACNCIRIEKGRMKGFNTDAYGFETSLLPYLQKQHKKALILGTGGASKAVAFVLEKLGISSLFISRSSTQYLSYNDVNEKIINSHKLIINTSPVGMYPHVNFAPQIPYDQLSSDHLLYDLIYNPSKTLFLQKGEERGATIVNGYDMLVLQAEESWRIWND